MKSIERDHQLLAAAIAILGGCVLIPHSYAAEGYMDTPLIPGTKWHVHDSSRPQPPVVAPGIEGARASIVPPPADAIVLFDGKDLSHWRGTDGTAQWTVENGFMEPNKTGHIYTKETFGSCQLHLEWAAPLPASGSSQERGNSGVFLMSHYEIQILDSFNNPTYADGTVGAVYGQTPPLVNACRPPGDWQTYDIIFTAPKFDTNRKLVKPATVTVLLNDVLVQNHTEILGWTAHRRAPSYKWHAAKESLMLQDHGNPVRFRNVWIRPLPESE